MKPKTLLSLVVFTLLTIACKNKEEVKDTKSKTTIGVDIDTHKMIEEHTAHWSYSGETGPEHWAEFEKESSCGGQSQSPINIIVIDAKLDQNLKPLALNYNANTKIHDVTNNGHSIQFNFEEGDFLMFNDEKYALKQFHFHEAAEHTINGVRYPIEIHLVHVNQNGEILVVGIMAEEGINSQPFSFLESYLPLNVDETKTVDAPFDMTSILPNNKAYYNYSGSLTTPPCSEDVTWVVLKTPITISEMQLIEIQKLMPKNNYRNQQPLNGRVVKMTN